LLLLLIAGVWIYKRLIRNRNLDSESWAGIEVQLQKRSELVPNLVKIVKGYVAHESEVLEDVSRMRASTEVQVN
jgi:LemA protein